VPAESPKRRAAANAAVALALSLGAAAAQELDAPWGIWIGVAILAGLLLLYAIYLYFVKKGLTMPGEPAASNPSVGQSVTHNTVGGDLTVVGSLSISSPQTRVHAEPVVKNQPTGDHYTTELLLKLDDPYAADRLSVEVFGSSIVRLEFRPDVQSEGGITAFRMEDVRRQGGPTHALQSVGGRLARSYRVFVTTATPDDLTVTVKLA
jgi:hypothetical protein